MGQHFYFFFSLMNWKLSDLVQIILRQVFQRVLTLQVVTGVAGTEDLEISLLH